MIGRTIPHSFTLTTNELYSKSKPDQVLQDVAMTEMVGLLRQVAMLSSSASDIFQGVLRVSTEISSRLDAAADKVELLSQRIPEVEKIFHNPQHSKTTFYLNVEERLVRDNGVKENLFTRETRDRTLNLKYDQCGRCPDFSEIDALWTAESKLRQGESCAKEFSNPNYFMEQWQVAEERRLQIERAEAAEAKAKRKQKKKRRPSRKMNLEQPIAAVTRKKYNPLGAEFGSPVSAVEDVRMKSISERVENNIRLATSPRPMSSNVNPPRATMSSVPIAVSPPTASQDYAMYGDHTENDRERVYSHESNQSWLPPPPPPPMSDEGSARPPVNLPSNANLLSAIKNADKSTLKRTESQSSAPPSMLDSIRCFQKANLRTVVRNDKPRQPVANPSNPMMMGVAEILSRRKAIEVEKDDDSESDEWTDDE